MYFALTFLLLGVKVFPMAFDFVISPFNKKIFNGKLSEISKKCSHIYYMHSNFKRKPRELFLFNIPHLHYIYIYIYIYIF